MARLSKEDKQELLAGSKGEFFRAVKRKPLTLDEFIEFLTYTNAFGNHKRRVFCPITGTRFKL